MSAKKPNKVVIKKSSKPEKKLMAVFSYPETTRTRTIHFGSAGMDDYTKTKDKEQRSRYLERHRRRENWQKPDTAGALSRWILWGPSTSRSENIRNFKSKFNLK
tara:strand:- start:287 stop:598 length:312 start_codon:yes stop_codon:yes gene_type:complete